MRERGQFEAAEELWQRQHELGAGAIFDMLADLKVRQGLTHGSGEGRHQVNQRGADNPVGARRRDTVVLREIPQGNTVPCRTRRTGDRWAVAAGPWVRRLVSGV
jgi:hypothetical protein